MRSPRRRGRRTLRRRRAGTARARACGRASRRPRCALVALGGDRGERAVELLRACAPRVNVCSGWRPKRRSCGVERGERRRAAHVRDPRPGLDRGRDLGDRAVGDAEEDELRARRVQGRRPARAGARRSPTRRVQRRSHELSRSSAWLQFRCRIPGRRSVALATEAAQQVRPHRRPLVVEHAVPRRVATQPAPRTSMCLRWMPSNCAGSAAIAPRERSLRASVFSSTRRQPSRSNACSSISSFASTFTPVPHASGVSHVQPISMLRCSGLQGEVARAADHAAVLAAHRHERQLGPGGRVRERRLDVRASAPRAFCGCSMLSHCQVRGVARRLPEPVLVLGRHRLEPHELAFEHGVVDPRCTSA